MDCEGFWIAQNRQSTLLLPCQKVCQLCDLGVASKVTDVYYFLCRRNKVAAIKAGLGADSTERKLKIIKESIVKSTVILSDFTFKTEAAWLSC